MNKKTNQYKITLEQVSIKDSDKLVEEPLIFEFDNHDEIFHIIQMLKEKNLFDDPNQSMEFGLGLKLFSEVMIKNRKHPLFEAFFPAFGEFMKKLKSQ